MTPNNPPATPEQSSIDPTLTRNGGLTYLEIPATNPRQSASFYQNVLGWLPRDPEADEPKFSDPTGHLIGRWVTGRAISRQPGLLPFIYVNDINDITSRVALNGGEIIKPPYPEGDLLIALIRDPAGNILGLWQAAGN